MLNILFRRNNNKLLKKYRLEINKILKENNLKTPIKEHKFYLFLYNDDFNQFKSWYEICSAKSDFDKKIEQLKSIIDIFSKSNNIISFKKLFQINKLWYDYYNTSADINGVLLPKEKRQGVNKKYIEDIMIIEKLLLHDDLEDISLDSYIIFYQKLKYIHYKFND